MQHETLRLEQVGLLHPDLSTPGQEVGGVVPSKERSWGRVSLAGHLSSGEELAELRRAALGNLRLQHADKLAELHAVIQLVHKKLGSHLLPQHAAEPNGQILLHGHQGGLMPHCQPLVILENVCQAGTVSLGQRAAGAPWAHRRGVKLLAEPNLNAGLDSHE